MLSLVPMGSMVLVPRASVLTTVLVALVPSVSASRLASELTLMLVPLVSWLTLTLMLVSRLALGPIPMMLVPLVSWLTLALVSKMS